MGKKNNQSNSSDLFCDIADCFSDLFVEFSKICIFLIDKLVEMGIEHYKMKRGGTPILKPVHANMLEKKRKVVDCKSLGWSVNHKKDFFLRDLNTKRHTGIIGSTGSGKSVCLNNLMEHSLQRGMPVIFFDPKASISSINQFKILCSKYNKTPYIFSNITGERAKFNPLLEGNLEDISDRIIKALSWSEQFYQNECIEALDLALLTLKNHNTPITFKNIIGLLEKYSNLKNIKGLLNQMRKVSNGEFGDLLNYEGTDALTFGKIRRQNKCLYIGISSMGLSSAGNILNKIFFGGLLTHCKEVFNGKIPGILNPEDHPIAVYFDELSSVIHEGFIDLQNKCRSAGVELTYATQCPSDIDKISPSLTTQIFENTNNLFVFNQIIPIHTEFFARTFGTVTATKKTHIMEDEMKTNSGSVRDVEEFLVHGNIFRQLGIGQCVLLQRIPKRVDLINIRFSPTIIPYQPQRLSEARSIF